MMKGKMGGKCSCGPGNFIWMIISAVVLGLGLWLLLTGIKAQWDGAGSWQLVLTWYAVAIIVIGIGKMFKMKACNCPAHGMHCM